LTNDEVSSCPYYQYNTTHFFGYCFPEPASTLETLSDVAQMASAADAQVSDGMAASDILSSFIVDVQNAWQVILYMTLISLATTLIYIAILKCLARPLLYISMLLVLVLFAGGGAWTWM